MKISVLAFLVICSMMLVGCGSDNKVDSNTNDNEIVKEEVQNPFAKKEIKLRTPTQVKDDYSAYRKDIIAKKQINFLDKEEIDVDSVLEYAKNSVKIANTNIGEKVSKKKDIVEKLVALDDLQHNTTNQVNTKVMIYLLDLWKEGKFEEAIIIDEQLELLYLSKYLDLALDNDPIFDVADDVAHNMYLLIKDKIDGKSRRIEKYKKNIDSLVDSVKDQLESL